MEYIYSHDFSVKSKIIGEDLTGPLSFRKFIFLLISIKLSQKYISTPASIFLIKCPNTKLKYSR